MLDVAAGLDLRLHPTLVDRSKQQGSALVALIIVLYLRR